MEGRGYHNRVGHNLARKKVFEAHEKVWCGINDKIPYFRYECGNAVDLISLPVAPVVPQAPIAPVAPPLKKVCVYEDCIVEYWDPARTQFKSVDWCMFPVGASRHTRPLRILERYTNWGEFYRHHPEKDHRRHQTLQWRESYRQSGYRQGNPFGQVIGVALNFGLNEALHRR